MLSLLFLDLSIWDISFSFCVVVHEDFAFIHHVSCSLPPCKHDHKNKNKFVFTGLSPGARSCYNLTWLLTLSSLIHALTGFQGPHCLLWVLQPPWSQFLCYLSSLFPGLCGRGQPGLGLLTFLHLLSTHVVLSVLWFWVSSRCWHLPGSHLQPWTSPDHSLSCSTLFFFLMWCIELNLGCAHARGALYCWVTIPALNSLLDSST